MSTETLRPNDAGDSTEFTPYPNTGEANWQDVDEEVADDATTDVYASATAAKDLYNIANPTFPDGATINSVTLYSRCKARSPIYTKGYYGIKSGATESWSAETTFGAAYAGYSTVFATDPNTGVAWTKAAITALQIGVQIDTGADSGMRCTQTYVVVDYTAVAAGKKVLLRKNQYLRRTRFYSALKLGS